MVCGSLVIRVASATCTSCDNTAHVTYDTIRLTGLSPPPRHSSLMDYLETHKIWVPGRHFSPVPLSEKWSRVTPRPLQPSSRYDMIDMLVWNLGKARAGNGSVRPAPDSRYIRYACPVLGGACTVYPARQCYVRVRVGRIRQSRGGW